MDPRTFPPDPSWPGELCGPKSCARIPSSASAPGRIQGCVVHQTSQLCGGQRTSSGGWSGSPLHFNPFRHSSPPLCCAEDAEMLGFFCLRAWKDLPLLSSCLLVTPPTLHLNASRCCPIAPHGEIAQGGISASCHCISGFLFYFGQAESLLENETEKISMTWFCVELQK